MCGGCLWSAIMNALPEAIPASGMSLQTFNSTPEATFLSLYVLLLFYMCGDCLWSAIMTVQPKAIPASGQTVISDV